MTWAEIDWPALERLRAKFLSGEPLPDSYWASPSDLASYDFTYGERIGWKWDAVLRELRLRGWRPPAGATLLDWGCGSGIAGRRVIAAFGAENFRQLVVWDHSPLAREFAADVATRVFPTLPVINAASSPGEVSAPVETETIGLLVISHVLNELSPEACDELRELCRRATAIL